MRIRTFSLFLQHNGIAAGQRVTISTPIVTGPCLIRVADWRGNGAGDPPRTALGIGYIGGGGNFQSPTGQPIFSEPNTTPAGSQKPFTELIEMYNAQLGTGVDASMQGILGTTADPGNVRSLQRMMFYIPVSGPLLITATIYAFAGALNNNVVDLQVLEDIKESEALCAYFSS